MPVYAMWHPSVGPLLSLGMLTAAARHHRDGALLEWFDIRRPEKTDSFLTHVGEHDGPAVLLCSQYVFTIDDNMAAAREGRAEHPGLFIIHGGPSTPKRTDDIERFFAEYGDIADLLVHGEAEVTICEVLEVLRDLPEIDYDRLATVAGLTFRDPRSGRLVHTGERERIADLDALPSPYLTGEFDHLPLSDWREPPYFETNRGCPYGCTFCDWGSATRSRIRKFGLDRVLAEFRWAAERNHGGLHICDANFGILPRDEELAAELAALRQTTDFPKFVIFTPAKNTTRHLTRILDELLGADIAVVTAISLQTTDPATLDIVARQNISTDGYLSLAGELHRRGHAMQGDLILGLPGQTYETYRADLQFMLDHEIMPRTFPLRLLPNAPMNAPEYRAEHDIHVDETHVVQATRSMSVGERVRMLRLRRIEAITERYGLLRHVMRYAQWDLGVPASSIWDVLVDLDEGAAEPYPVIAETIADYIEHPTPRAGWQAFYAEVRQLIAAVAGVPADEPGLGTVLAVQEFLMPERGRTFPATMALDHDYVSYYASATAELFRSGRAGVPERPLTTYPAASLTVAADPLGLCDTGLHFPGDNYDAAFEGDFHIGAIAANELLSPLVRIVPGVSSQRDMVEARLALARASASAVSDDATVRHPRPPGVPVPLGRSRR